MMKKPKKASNVVVSAAAIEIEARSSGESCFSHYFQGNYQAKNWYLRGKNHCSLGRLYRGLEYAEVGYERFYCSCIPNTPSKASTPHPYPTTTTDLISYEFLLILLCCKSNLFFREEFRLMWFHQKWLWGSIVG